MAPALAIAVGLVLLGLGGEFLVRGATRLALSLGVPIIVVGLTVVALGTSVPELVTGIVAQLGGQVDLAIGNIIGSNIANLCLILAIGGLLVPLPVRSETLRRDIPFLVATSLVFAVMVGDGYLRGYEGSLLLALLVGFVVLQVRWAMGEREGVVEEFREELTWRIRIKKLLPVSLSVAFIAVGLLLMVFGGQTLVQGAVAIAETFGIEERIIGLTIVAIGTSLPELATTIIAVLKRETEVAVGNALGSNIFNTLGIGGTVALVRPAEIAPALRQFDLPFMIGTTILCGVLLWNGGILRRWEAGLLLAIYALYLMLLL